MFNVFAIPLPKIVNFFLKGKDFGINSGFVRHSFIFIVVFLSTAISTVAQVENPIKNPAGTLPVRQDTARVPADTIPNRSDSLNITSDSLKIQPDTIPPPKGDIETTINYTARDSIRASVDGKGPFFSFSAPLSGQYDANGRAQGPQAPCYKPPWGELVAVNANTGDIAWRVRRRPAVPGARGHVGRQHARSARAPAVA